MATSGTTYRQILAELKKGNYKPVYYLMGDEPFFIDSLSDYIRENALPEEARDFNQLVDVLALRIRSVTIAVGSTQVHASNLCQDQRYQ